MSELVCVEMYDGQSFCRGDYRYKGVHQQDWHFPAAWLTTSIGRTPQDSANEIKQATCVECLRRISMMGDVARERLAELEP